MFMKKIRRAYQTKFNTTVVKKRFTSTIRVYTRKVLVASKNFRKKVFDCSCQIFFH